MKTTIETTVERVRTPNRDEEIAILRDAIRKLGPLSYCGPWLAEQLDGIERDLRCDFFPQMDRKGAIRDCAHLVAVAEGNAREIEAAAGRVAKAKTDEAHAQSVAISSRLAQELRKCMATIGHNF